MTEKRIFEACSWLEEHGRAVTNRSVISHLGGGNRNDICRGVRNWKNERAAGRTPAGDDRPPRRALTREEFATSIAAVERGLSEQLAKQAARLAAVEKLLAEARSPSRRPATRRVIQEDIVYGLIQLESRLTGKHTREVATYFFKNTKKVPPAGSNAQRRAAKPPAKAPAKPRRTSKRWFK